MRSVFVKPDQVVEQLVVKGTAFGLKQIFERGKECWGVQPDFLPGVGGGARSALWTQIKNEVLGVPYLPYRCAAQPDTAALVGAIAAGVFAGTGDPDIPFVAPTAFAADSGQPAQATDRRYIRAFHAYDKLYRATREVMHMLSGITSQALVACVLAVSMCAIL